MRKLRFDITLHTRGRYKQRVKDDTQRYKCTDGQISRRIRGALSYIKDAETLPILGDYRVAEAYFKVKGGSIGPYFSLLLRDRLGTGKYLVTTILTQEMHRRGLPDKGLI